MPTLPLYPCSFPGCPQRVAAQGKRYCAAHEKQTRAQQNKQRQTQLSADYDHQWRKLRHAYLSAHPLCVLCMAEEQRPTPATVVDHIEPIATHPHLRLVWDNLRALCKRHHDAHTARTRGWGRGGSNR